MSELMMGTKHEDMNVLAHVVNAEASATRAMYSYFREIAENYSYVAGRVYSQADLAKLNLENRPAFSYNLFLPILLKLASSFKQNIGKIIATPRTPGDFKMSLIMTDLVDYILNTANDIPYEITKAYINAIIARVGWVYGDFRYTKGTDGMFMAESYNPFRLLYDTSKATQDTKKWSYIIDRGYYTPEEILNIYAYDDDDMWAEIEEKVGLILGPSEIKQKKILTMIERVWGIDSNVYQSSRDRGYDDISNFLGNYVYLSPDYCDTMRGTFKVIEAHERKVERIHTMFDPIKQEEFNISKFVAGKDGKFDRAKMSAFREFYYTQNGAYPLVRAKVINQLYQTTVCPALNMVLYDEPYPVQNENFKHIPVFCFQFGEDILDWKSYIDHLIDPVQGFNLDMNTMQTYLMRTATGETWYEDDALGEYEDDFTNTRINAHKKVKQGAISRKKIQRINPPALPPGMADMASKKELLTKTIPSITDSALGRMESPNESGKLAQQRTVNTDLLQILPQDNAVKQLKLLGENVVDYSCAYMTPGTVVRIVSDETNPYWLQINEESITRLFHDKEGNGKNSDEIQGKLLESRYDIKVEHEPYTAQAKQQQREDLFLLTDFALKIGRVDYVDFPMLIKATNIRQKEEWLTKIQEADQRMMEQQQAQAQAQALKDGLENKKAEIETADKENEVKSKTEENQILEAVNEIINKNSA